MFLNKAPDLIIITFVNIIVVKLINIENIGNSDKAEFQVKTVISIITGISAIVA